MDPVLFRIVIPSADRKRSVDFVCGDIRDHIIKALIAVIIYFQIIDPQLLQHLRRHVLHDTGHISLRVGVTVRHIVFQVSDTQHGMFIQPCFFSCRKRHRGKGRRIILCLQRVDVIGFLHRKHFLSGVQFLQEIRTFLIDTEEVIRFTERHHDFRVFSAVSSVAFCRQDIQLPGIKISEKRLVILIGSYIGRHILFRQKTVQNVLHRAVQHADRFPGKACRIGRDIRIRAMLDQAIGFIAHGVLRISDLFFSVFLPGKTCQKIDLTIQKHLIQVAEAAVNIFIFPSGVFRQLQIVLICVPFLGFSCLCTFLEHFVFIVANQNRFFICLLRIRIAWLDHPQTRKQADDRRTQN